MVSYNVKYTANVEGLPQFGYLMLCPPSDDALKKRKNYLTAMKAAALGA